MLKNKFGERVFFSENWPDNARQWLPMIDHPYDKATSEFISGAPRKSAGKPCRKKSAPKGEAK